MVVQAFSGTTWSGYAPTKQYINRKKQVATDLTGAEYADFIQKVLRRFRRESSSKQRKLIFVWDRDPAHGSREVKQLLAGTGVQVEILPPRSPDLDPLDYAVFGHSKNWLARGGIADWDQRCTAFVKHLESLDAKRQVAGYTRRLLQVVAARGGHIARG